MSEPPRNQIESLIGWGIVLSELSVWELDKSMDESVSLGQINLVTDSPSRRVIKVGHTLLAQQIDMVRKANREDRLIVWSRSPVQIHDWVCRASKTFQRDCAFRTTYCALLPENLNVFLARRKL